MTQEEKQLLLKDILPRQLYGVKAHYQYYDFVGSSERLIQEGDGVIKSINLSLGNPIYIDNHHVELENIKPYLRPMSSMNSKEWMEYCDACVEDEKSWVWAGKEYKFTPVAHREEFLNSHHFDYRGLIPMGLALEAPEDMYKEIKHGK